MFIKSLSSTKSRLLPLVSLVMGVGFIFHCVHPSGSNQKPEELPEDYYQRLNELKEPKWDADGNPVDEQGNIIAMPKGSEAWGSDPTAQTTAETSAETLQPQAEPPRPAHKRVRPKAPPLTQENACDSVCTEIIPREGDPSLKYAYRLEFPCNQRNDRIKHPCRIVIKRTCKVVITSLEECAKLCPEEETYNSMPVGSEPGQCKLGAKADLGD